MPDLHSIQSPQSNGDKAVGSAALDTKRSQKPENSKLGIEKEHAELKAAYSELSSELRKTQADLRASQKEFKQLQEQDFGSRRRDRTESHDKISQQFLDIFRMSDDWARDYFKIDFKLFCLDEHELFKKHLSAILWDERCWATKKKLNVRHLVQAVLAEFIARRILLVPLEGCENDFRDQISYLYTELLKRNKSEAHKLRAVALTTYGRCEVWPPSAATSEPIIQHRQNYYQKLAEEIDSVLGSIAKKHFPERLDHERVEKSMAFIEAAGNLALTLGKQAAELKVMDKAWFENTARVFICDDERMKGRFAEEDEDSGEAFQVDIVLRPGFLKYGNDDGENFDKHAVWVPAMLDLRDSTAEPESHTQADTESEDQPEGARLSETRTDQVPPPPHQEQNELPLDLSHKQPTKGRPHRRRQKQQVSQSPKVKSSNKSIFKGRLLDRIAELRGTVSRWLK